MKHAKRDAGGFWVRLLNGRAFYLAVAAILVAICGIAAATFLDSKLAVEPPPENPKPATAVTTQPTAPTTTKKDAEVNLPVTGIPAEDPTTATTTTTQPAADLFVYPLSNTVIKPFSGGQAVFSKTMGDYRVHNGTDFKGEAGQEVKAVADGTVKDIRSDLMMGGVIVLDHGFGTVSTYYGVAPRGIQKGQSVKVGQVIGSLDNVPCESADVPHLHLEMTQDGRYVDPVKAIGLPVR